MAARSFSRSVTDAVMRTPKMRTSAMSTSTMRVFASERWKLVPDTEAGQIFTGSRHLTSAFARERDQIEDKRKNYTDKPASVREWDQTQGYPITNDMDER